MWVFEVFEDLDLIESFILRRVSGFIDVHLLSHPIVTIVLIADEIELVLIDCVISEEFQLLIDFFVLVVLHFI